MNWATDYPARFLRERKELDRLEGDVDWLRTTWSISETGLITVDLDLNIHEHTYEGRMTYPVTFPDSPPYIYPRDCSEQWSDHQYGAGGTLCLEWRVDNWSAGISGADMVRSAHKLLNAEKHPELPHTVPSAHRLTMGQRLRMESQRFLFTLELFSSLLKRPFSTKTGLKSAIVYSNDVKVLFVTSLADDHGTFQQVPDLPEGITKCYSLFSISGEGWVFRSKAFDQQQSYDSAETLVQFLSESGFVTDDILVQQEGEYLGKTIVILGTDIDSLRVFLIKSDKKSTLIECKYVDPSPGWRSSKMAQQLSEVRVGIVGLGSVGSKVAISLARSGVRRFLLVDDDYLAPGNMVRHELLWDHAGVHKAKAIAEVMSLTAAGIQVDTRVIRLGGQESAAVTEAALKDLSNCDLLIDATANPEVFLILAALAKRHQKSLCWGEIFAGGYGGMIARARPFRDPNPLAVRDAFYNYLETQPAAPFKRAAGYDGNEEQPLVAFDSDVGFIAAALTRLAIDTALSRDPSEFPSSLYLLGMRSEWIFSAPFDTHPIDVQGPGWESHDSIENDEDKHTVEEILKQMRSEERHVESDSAN